MALMEMRTIITIGILSKASPVNGHLTWGSRADPNRHAAWGPGDGPMSPCRCQPQPP
jgi:hypothetical protein